MFEVVCPTCESMVQVTKNILLGDKIECPECGEILRVISIDPFEVEYMDTEADDEEEYLESTEEILDSESETVFKSDSYAEDEENESFELPDKSSLFENPEELDEGSMDEGD
jgi:lysine biosynthesis protein LysW